jgi:3-methylfumaryl-CoA hydratase
VNIDIESLKQWIGRGDSDVDYVTIPSVHRLAATLDRDDPMPKIGDPLPPGWHYLLCPRVERHSLLGRDGHPEGGDFMPPVPLPRRMFASRRTEIVSPLRVGDEVKRTSAIKDVILKEGRSGTMVFVTVRTEFHGPRGLAIIEEQDNVFRGEPDKNAPPPAPQPAPGVVVWSRTITPDPVMLFRYSALTFNAHRIHTDQPYATGVEGYPERVVNGGLTTLLAFELVRAHAATPLVYISSRALKPLFVNRALTVCGEPSADGKAVKLWALNDMGELALSATGKLA